MSRCLFSKNSEMHVISAMINSVEATAIGLKVLEATDFYHSFAEMLFRAISDTWGDTSKKSYNWGLLYEYIVRKEGAEAISPEFYAEICQTDMIGTSIEEHAEIVLDYSRSRQLQHMAQKMLQRIEAGTPASHLQVDCEEVLNKLASKAVRAKEPELLSDSIMNLLDQIDQRESGQKQSTFGHVPIGLTTLKREISGGMFRPGQVITIGGVPGSGKSALAARLLIDAARHDLPSLIFSLEMDSNELAERFIAIEQGVNLRMASDEPFHPSVIAQMMDTRDKNYPIWIDGRADHTMQSIVATASRFVRKHGIKLIAIDYMQLIQADRLEKRYLEVGNISRNIKRLAKSLNVPVINLAQLNREYEKRPGKEPRLSDFRESGSIEQDTDIAILLWPKPYDTPKPPDKQDIVLKIEKQRGGTVGQIDMIFNRPFTRFEDKDWSIL